jgi:hypothetical protein
VSSIFIQIASYRDFELSKTILSAVNTQSGRHSIHFGVFNLYQKENEIYIPTLPNLKVIEKEAPEGLGVGKSRNIANSLYDGEDYYLQIDSHTRFKKNWDQFYVNEVKKFQECGIKKPLLTTYPGSYSYGDNLQEVMNLEETVNIVSFKEHPENFTNSLIPSQLGVAPEGRAVNRSVSAGSIFTVGSFSEMDFNDKIVFWGEEILLAAKSFTNGFDLLIPSQQQIFHLYYNHSQEVQRNGRRHIWKDFPTEWSALDAISKIEVEDILSTARVGKDALGTVRTLKEFGDYVGLDFENRTVIL